MSINWRNEGREYTRSKVRARDNFTCQDCRRVWNGGERHFDVHHLNGICGKKSRAYDRISDMIGLITLCHKCHYNRHDFSIKMRIPVDKSNFETIRLMRFRDKKTLQYISKHFGVQIKYIKQVLTRCI